MTDIAARNRAIKKTLAAVFGKNKVSVRGHRGTAHGWVSIDIDYTPRDPEARQELRTLCKTLLRKANIDLGFTYTDDTCQYTSDQCHLNFNRSRFERTFRMADDGILYGKVWDRDEYIAL